MSFEMVVSLVGLLAGVCALIAFFDGKIKDAEKMGALKNRVEQLESQQLKNEASKEDINSLFMAIGKMTGQIESLQKTIQEVKDDMKCIERHKE